MKITLAAFLLFASSICYGASSDTLILVTEKIKGKKIIPSNYLDVFQKANEDLGNFKYEKFADAEVALFKLRLNNDKLYLYCLTIKKDNLIQYVFDNDNDKDFTNNELKTFGRLDADPMTEPVEFNFGYGKTWVGIKSIKTNYQGSLIDMYATIFEYRIARFQNQDTTFIIRMEPSTGLEYYSQATLINSNNYNGNADITTGLGEFIKLGRETYQFIYSTEHGDTIKLVLVNKKEALTGTQIGYKASDIKGINLSGDSISLNNFNGKFVLLDFWFSGCQGCVTEMKELLSGIYDVYGGDYFEIVGVNVLDSKKVLSQFIKDNNYKWTQMLVPINDAVDAYHIKSYPSLYLLDTNGYIIENKNFGLLLPSLLNKTIPEDFLVKKLLSKKNKFSYSGFPDSKFALLYVKNKEGVLKQYYLYNHDGKWQYSLDLMPGTYYYYFNFEMSIVTDPNNPKTKVIDKQIYSELKISK